MKEGVLMRIANITRHRRETEVWIRWYRDALESEAVVPLVPYHMYNPS